MSPTPRQFTRSKLLLSSDLRCVRTADGFSLIEVVMATMVLALAILGCVAALQFAARELDGARMGSAAAQAMQNEVERIRLLSWTGIAALPASEAVALSTDLTAQTAVRNRMSLQRDVADVADTGSPAKMKEIVLTARWRAIDGTSHERVFRMRYAKNGLYDYYYSSGSS